MEVFVNGQFLPASQATVSVQDRGLLYGDGLFETIRAEAGRPVWLKQPSSPTGAIGGGDKSNPAAGFSLGNSGFRSCWNEMTYSSLAAVKILITRGEIATLGLPETDQPTIIIYARKYEPPPAEEYRTGWPVISFPERRTEFFKPTQEPELPILPGGPTVCDGPGRPGRIDPGSRRHGCRRCDHGSHLAGGQYFPYAPGRQCFSPVSQWPYCEKL